MSIICCHWISSFQEVSSVVPSAFKTDSGITKKNTVNKPLPRTLALTSSPRIIISIISSTSTKNECRRSFSSLYHLPYTEIRQNSTITDRPNPICRSSAITKEGGCRSVCVTEQRTYKKRYLEQEQRKYSRNDVKARNKCAEHDNTCNKQHAQQP